MARLWEWLWGYQFYFIMFYYILYVCVYLWACFYHTVYMEVREQHVGVRSLLPPRGFPGSNRDNHAWQQASLPLGPFCQPWICFHCRCSLILCISVWFAQSTESYFFKKINKFVFNHCKANLPGKSHQCVLKLGTEAWQETECLCHLRASSRKVLLNQKGQDCRTTA